MGLFGLFSKKESAKNYVDLIKTFGIDVFHFSNEGLAPLDLSIDDEVSGVISKYGGEFKHAHFDHVITSERKDGMKSFYFSGHEKTERDLKKLVDELFIVMGEDGVFKREMSPRDLNIIRGLEEDYKATDDIREWNTHYTNGVTFIITISYDLRNNMMDMFIHSRMTWDWEKIYDKVKWVSNR